VCAGTGKVTGVLATDNIALVDGSLALSNHAFGVAVAETQDFAASDVPFAGLMGLALVSSLMLSTMCF